VQPINKLNC
jgi:hypothetical protein